MHYQRRWVEQAKRCAIDGCERPGVRSGGLCPTHHARMEKWGDPLSVAQLGDQNRRHAPGARCAVQGCERPRYQKEWCSAHYQRWRRHGDPLVSTRKAVADDPTYLDRRGYWVERWHTGHVLAMNNGHIRRGRRVLFDKIGYGPHRCKWCGRHVNWGFRGGDRLTVDHLDWDNENDDPANLEPSCTSCNSRRKRAA